MKTGHLLILFLICSSVLTAQKKDETRFIRESETEFHSFNNSNYPGSIKLPFNQIIILDKRFDTTKIGYTYENLGNKYSKIILKNSWTDILNSYFKSNLDPNANQSLVIVVQSFWMKFGTLAEIQRIKNVKNAFKEEADRGGTCTAELDVFISSDSTYQALFRIDTSFLSLSNFKNNLDIFFFMPFDSVVNKLSTGSVSEVIAKRRKIGWRELDSVYKKRLDIPVLKAGQPARGIFLTYNNFRDNKPVYTDFKFKNGKLTDELFVVENGRERLIEKYWGFSDSSGLYIQLGLNAFKAIRQQNTFELVGFQHINMVRNYDTGRLEKEGPLEKLLANKTRKIFQLNMKTGRLN